MAQQETYDGFSPGVYGTSAPHTPAVLTLPAPPPPLRPLSTGEVLDRTFTLYRKRFWLFVGIGTLPAAVLTLSTLIRLIYLAVTHRPVPGLQSTPADVLAGAMNTAVLSLYLLPVTLLFVVAYSVSHAAIVNAVGSITQGVAVTAASAYSMVQVRWLRWTGIAVRQFWTFFWPLLVSFVLLGGALLIPGVRGNTVAAGVVFLLFGILAGAGFVLGMINLLRVMLAVPAGVQENLGINASMRRSRDLVAGRKGRIFLALLLVYALQLVAGGIQVPLVLLAAMTHGGQQILLQTIQIAVQFVATALVSPIASIALCLFYIDERVRREGYDIELLMRHSFSGRAIAQTPQEMPDTSPVGPSA